MKQRDLKGPIRLGILGLGAAGRAFLPAIRKHPAFQLVALADPAPAVRQSVSREYDAVAYDNVHALLRHPGLDAVLIATPTELHPLHVELACAAGVHVLVEKPIAVKMEQARRMVAQAEQAGLVLIVGHSHSYDLPIKRMREIITRGVIGPVRMVHTWCYTDWMYRPRRPEELDTELGGGVTYRQGSHQFDILRLLCGGNVRSVKAKTFDMDGGRRGIGAHSVFLDFDDGACGTAVYNGYGRFNTMDLCFNVSEWGYAQLPHQRSWARRPAPGTTPQDELLAKQARAKSAIPADAPLQPFFGLTMVSCERGDIRQSPEGLLVYSDQGQEEIKLPADATPRDAVLAEFHDAITGIAPAVHDGRWGLANLEVCEAAITSSESGREVFLDHQSRDAQQHGGRN